jgi:hypothetical protein
MTARLGIVTCVLVAVVASGPPGFAQGRDPGCLPLALAESGLDPADLALGARTCIAGGNFERAVGLIALLRARMSFDMARIEGGRADVAVQGLLDDMRAAMSDAEMAGLDAAYAPLAKQGGEGHQAFCASLRQMEPPSYVPDYVARLDGTGGPVVAVAGFDAAAGWAAVIDDFMACPAPAQ